MLIIFCLIMPFLFFSNHPSNRQKKLFFFFLFPLFDFHQAYFNRPRVPRPISQLPVLSFSLCLSLPCSSVQHYLVCATSDPNNGIPPTGETVAAAAIEGKATTTEHGARY